MRLAQERIKQLCYSRGMRLKDLLNQAGVSRTAYYSLVRQGRVLPRSIHALAATLGVCPADLLVEEDDFQARVQLGIDVLLREKIDLLKGKRVALLAHGASVNSRLEPTPRLLYQHPDVNLTLLFGPEHGLFGTAQDMEGVSSSRDPETGLEVISLYGSTLESLKPRVEQLDRFDVLVCDLQDVGSRYYTYIYTMALCMEACAEAGKQVIVLDRPNPLNGIDIEGNILKKKFASFVGLYPLPVRHGMTIAELANFLNEQEGIGCDLTVIPMRGWQREWYFDQTRLPFIAPSPNMPTLNTAIVYPGMCLIEATELSEGRGTTMPFEWVGAPYFSADELAENLNEQGLEGIYFRPIRFKPNYQKWHGEECSGVQLHVTDRNRFKPYKTGLILVKTIRDLYPEKFHWRERPYEFVTDIPAIDLLTGSNEYRRTVSKAESLEPWFKKCQADADKFRRRRKPYLLY